MSEFTVTQSPLLKALRARPPFARFLYYIRERYRMRNKKLEGGRVLTMDPILATYKFTNVKREWDRTSQWLITNWHAPHASHEMAGMGAAVARFIGRPESLALIGHPAEVGAGSWAVYARNAKRTLNHLRAAGGKVFTGAYIVSGSGSKKGSSKVDHVFDAYLTPVAKSGVLHRTWSSAYDLHDALMPFNGWGHFMTQEVVLDCMFTHVLAKAKDRTKYAMPGPGARRGLARLANQGMRNHLHYRQMAVEEARSAMHTLHHNVVTALGKHPLASILTVHDIEFCLCEFDKYERALWNQGTPKARYTPTPT